MKKLKTRNLVHLLKVQSMASLLFLGLLFNLVLASCDTDNPNINEDGEDILQSHETILATIKNKDLNYVDTLYVPIYSDIYVNATNTKNLLAATLSLRNTSIKDSLYISTIDYFDTQGYKVRSYLEGTLLLQPLQSIDYVIEREDEIGGSGANFIITMSAKNSNMKPIIQAVMIGYDGNKGFAFTTDGYSIKG